jgi:hypothetical protein
LRAFACDNCRSLIFFENSVCITCRSPIGFHRPSAQLVVLSPQLAYTDEVGLRYRPCLNKKIAECNWLASIDADEGLCDCCQYTRTRPADDDRQALPAFARTEAAKRRLVFQLDSLALPTTTRERDSEHGLAFDLLSSRRASIITGHNSGLITIDLAEGDDAHREMMRVRLAEPYRTLLGHLRHEIGHWYWDVLIDRTPFYDRFHDLFGDERLDYQDALASHYPASSASGNDDWVQSYVSQYASAHPWEDWAETFAHYLHIRDTLQTSAAWGVHVAGPDLDLSVAWDAQLSARPTDAADEFGELLRTWLPLTYSMNAQNRSMGKDDLYPFVLAPAVVEKLRFVHVVVTAVR